MLRGRIVAIGTRGTGHEYHECRSTFFGVLIAPPLASACFPELHAGKLWGGRRCLRRRRRRRWLRPHRPRHLFLRCIPFVRARTYHTILELLASFFTFRDDLDCRILPHVSIVTRFYRCPASAFGHFSNLGKQYFDRGAANLFQECK